MFPCLFGHYIYCTIFRNFVFSEYVKHPVQSVYSSVQTHTNVTTPTRAMGEKKELPPYVFSVQLLEDLF